MVKLKCRGYRLQDLEEFLELHHQLPVGLDKVVAEVVLAGVDTSARYLQQIDEKEFIHDQWKRVHKSWL